MNNFSLFLIVLYFFTFFFTIIGRYWNIKIANMFAIIISFITFIIASLRPESFPDVDTYEIIFDAASVGDFSNELYWLSHGEPGFKIIIYLLFIFGVNFWGFLLFMAVLSFLLLGYISKISKIPFVYIWYTYFSFFFITRDLGIIRLSIASHLIVLMFWKKKTLSKVITLLIASLTFQYFALIAIAAPILSKIKINIILVFVLLIVSFTLSKYINFESFSFLIPEKQMATYEGTDQVSSGGGSSGSAIIRNLISNIIILYLFRKDTKNSMFNSWIWSAFLSVLIYTLTANVLIISQRFSAYFGAIIPIAYAYKMNKKDKSENLFIFILFLSLINFIITFYYNDFVWNPLNIIKS